MVTSQLYTTHPLRSGLGKVLITVHRWTTKAIWG